MVTLSMFKINYNKVLDREKKSEIYFKDAKVKDIERYLPLFNEITTQLSNMMHEYERIVGKEMADEEALNGFKEV